MLTFIPTSKENFDDLKSIILKPDKGLTIDSPMEAYEMGSKYKYCYPISIYFEDEIIAFLNYELLNEEHTNFLIWDFVVSHQYRGKGYGKKIMIQLLEMLKSKYNAKRVELAYDPKNSVAKYLYLNLGFIENGKINDDGEVEMVLKIN